MTDQRRTIALTKLAQTQLNNYDVAEAARKGGYLDYCEIDYGKTKKKFRAVMSDGVSVINISLVEIIACTLYDDLIEHMKPSINEQVLMLTSDYTPPPFPCSNWLDRQFQTRRGVDEVITL